MSFHIKNMILILFLINLALTNFQYVILTRVTVISLNIQTPFNLNLLLIFKKIKNTQIKHKKDLHQQSLLLIDSDITSDDDELIYTRIPNDTSVFLSDTTLADECSLESLTCYITYYFCYRCTNTYKNPYTLFTNNTFL